MWVSLFVEPLHLSQKTDFYNLVALNILLKSNRIDYLLTIKKISPHFDGDFNHNPSLIILFQKHLYEISDYSHYKQPPRNIRGGCFLTLIFLTHPIY